jgi:hypothetical protein
MSYLNLKKLHPSSIGFQNFLRSGKAWYIDLKIIKDFINNLKVTLGKTIQQ